MYRHRIEVAVVIQGMPRTHLQDRGWTCNHAALFSGFDSNRRTIERNSNAKCKNKKRPSQ